MLDKNRLISLGLKHNFLNWVEHETPPNYFPHPEDSYTGADKLVDLQDSILELHNLLCAIYAEVDIV
jgi:hypothetical protein